MGENIFLYSFSLGAQVTSEAWKYTKSRLVLCNHAIRFLSGPAKKTLREANSWLSFLAIIPPYLIQESRYCGESPFPVSTKSWAEGQGLQSFPFRGTVWAQKKKDTVFLGTQCFKRPLINVSIVLVQLKKEKKKKQMVFSLLRWVFRSWTTELKKCDRNITGFQNCQASNTFFFKLTQLEGHYQPCAYSIFRLVRNTCL